VQESDGDLLSASSQTALVVSGGLPQLREGRRNDPVEGVEEASDKGFPGSVWEDDDVGPSADGWEHSVDQMFVLVCQQQAYADRSPCLSFDPAKDSPRHRCARGLPSLQDWFVAPPVL
jgi:hypothetical protein